MYGDDSVYINIVYVLLSMHEVMFQNITATILTLRVMKYNINIVYPAQQVVWCHGDPLIACEFSLIFFVIFIFLVRFLKF